MITGHQTISGGMLHVNIQGSGVLWELSPDESIVLAGYREVRQYGAGSLYLEMHAGRITKWDVKPNIGGVEQLNKILHPTKLTD